MKKIVSVLVIALFLSSALVFAGGIALSGMGARAIGLGGGFRGVADDYTSIYWNPAGLAFSTHNSIALGMFAIIPKGEYTPDLHNPDPGMEAYPWAGIENGKKYETIDKTWVGPNVYYTRKAGESKFNFGVGLFVPYALGAEWDIFELPETMPVDMDGDGIPETNAPLEWPAGFPENEIKSSIQVIELHPAFSYKLTECLSVGFGIGMLKGDIDIVKFVPTVNIDPSVQGSSPLTYLPTIMELEGTGYGFGANFGVIHRVNEKFQWGISGKIPSTLKIEGDAVMTAYLNQIVAAQLGLNAPTADRRDLDAEADLKLPADVGVGIGFRPNPNWLIAGDITWTQWDRLDEIVIELDGNLPVSGAPADEKKLTTNWDSTIRFSVGTEYTINSLTLRTGYYLDPSPIPDETLDPTWPDVSDKHSINLGFGFRFGKIKLDAEYEYIHFSNRTVHETHINDEGSIEAWQGEYGTHIDAFNFAIEYMF